jgi:hypothetical protein
MYQDCQRGPSTFSCLDFYRSSPLSTSISFYYLLLRIQFLHQITFFFDNLTQFFQSPHAYLRKLALGCINQYIVVMPSVSICPPPHFSNFLNCIICLCVMCLLLGTVHVNGPVSSGFISSSTGSNC